LNRLWIIPSGKEKRKKKKENRKGTTREAAGESYKAVLCREAVLRREGILRRGRTAL
jgi:hypothetical protein